MLSLTVKVTLLFKMVSESSHNVGLFTVILIVPQNFNNKKHHLSVFPKSSDTSFHSLFTLFSATVRWFHPTSYVWGKKRERERERLTHVEEVVNCLKQDFIQHWRCYASKYIYSLSLYVYIYIYICHLFLWWQMWIFISHYSSLVLCLTSSFSNNLMLKKHLFLL